MSKQFTASDEIKTVTRMGWDRLCKCPHCQAVIQLDAGPVRGEQFQHRACGGWFDVSQDVRVVDTL